MCQRMEFYIPRLASFNFQILNCFFPHSHSSSAAAIIFSSGLSKTGTFVAFQEVDKSIHQKILCGETQSRKVMSAGKEQIKLALN